MQQLVTRTKSSACPHDCPSGCSLEVIVEGETRIGRISGDKSQTYTSGVICAKVARYAERIHHPERLLYPLKRTGPKGSGQFARISWDEALAEIAEKFLAAERDFGPQSVWLNYYAGTMGKVMRLMINNELGMDHPFHLHGLFACLGTERAAIRPLFQPTVERNCPYPQGPFDHPARRLGDHSMEGAQFGLLVFSLPYGMAFGGGDENRCSVRGTEDAGIAMGVARCATCASRARKADVPLHSQSWPSYLTQSAWKKR